MRRRANSASKPAKDDGPRYGERESPTGTVCPVDGCGLPQWSCPSGVACDNGHGGSDLGPPIDLGSQLAAPGAAFADLADDDLSTGSIDGDLGVVERDFDVDFDAEYRRLKRALTLRVPADQAALGVLTRALDEAHDNAYRAHVLACVAEHRLEMFEVDAEIKWADLRARAVEKLTEERRRQGARAKAITDADVRGMLAHVAPAEWREHVSQKKKIELAAEHVKKLADVWRLRCSALDTMVKSKK